MELPKNIINSTKITLLSFSASSRTSRWPHVPDSLPYILQQLVLNKTFLYQLSGTQNDSSSTKRLSYPPRIHQEPLLDPYSWHNFPKTLKISESLSFRSTQKLRVLVFTGTNISHMSPIIIIIINIIFLTCNGSSRSKPTTTINHQHT